MKGKSTLARIRFSDKVCSTWRNLTTSDFFNTEREKGILRISVDVISALLTFSTLKERSKDKIQTGCAPLDVISPLLTFSTLKENKEF